MFYSFILIFFWLFGFVDGEPGAVWIFAHVILGSDGLGEFGYAIAKVYYGVDVGSDLHLGDRAGFLQVGGGGLGAKGAELTFLWKILKVSPTKFFLNSRFPSGEQRRQ